ncbi:hypothetical protein [Aureibacter tunicatorum]|uniref:Uncharacterized protein n=1 Tax=Aureibacter tunicatorum TaxID=866807 RepID=A0AAE3XKD9_9BACT|nr:hypothetical protein [Aureibacter tunicatorum]MDR6238502.1 hypothetical protein [Aureibacter tunicatorum]BDD05565.1 hypothetical protein AUTU_30480 [Aureibacter tunicatorum]
MTKTILIQLTAIWIIAGCTPSQTDRPQPQDYKLGEKWVWKWHRKVEGEVKAEGKDIQEIVDYKGDLGFWNGVDTVQLSASLEYKHDDTPFRDWPLFVGKKWKYESEWENNEGTTGKTSQDVEVVAFEELNVEAGKFMAYKIEYNGTVTNSRGFNGQMSDTWWYAPELKTYIKHINDDGYGIYTNELSSYSNKKRVVN